MAGKGFEWLRFTRRRDSVVHLAVGGGNIAGLVLGIGTGVLTARALGPALRGDVVAVQTWAGTAAVLLTAGMTQAVVTYRGPDRHLPKPLILQVVIASVVGFLLFAGIRHGGHTAVSSWAAVLGATLLVSGGVLSSNNAGLAQRQHRMTGAFQLVRLAPQALAGVMVVLLWARNNDSPGDWILLLGVSIAVSSGVLAAHMFGKGGLDKAARWRPPADLVLSARAAFFLVVGSQVIYQLDRIVVASRMESRSVGYYAVCTAAAGACALFGQSVGMVTFSRLREISTARERRTLIRRGVLLALIITGGVALLLIAATSTLIRVLYGPEFLPATTATQVLLASSVPLAADYLLVHAAMSIGASTAAVRIQILAGALTVVLLVLATASTSLALVSAVSVVAYTVSATLLYRAVIHRLDRDQKALDDDPVR